MEVGEMLAKDTADDPSCTPPCGGPGADGTCEKIMECNADEDNEGKGEESDLKGSVKKRRFCRVWTQLGEWNST